MKTVLNTIIWIHVSVWLVLVAGFLFPAMSIIMYGLIAIATLLLRAITETMIWLMGVTKFVPEFFYSKSCPNTFGHTLHLLGD